MLLGHLQVLGLISAIQAQWSAVVVQFFDIGVRTVSDFGSEIPVVECVLSGMGEYTVFFWKFFLYMSIPLLGFVLPWILYGAKWVLQNLLRFGRSYEQSTMEQEILAMSREYLPPAEAAVRRSWVGLTRKARRTR